MLPTHVQRLLGENRKGPNCWNATLVYFDPATPIDYTEKHVICDWLQESTEITDVLRDGVILVLRSDWHCDETSHTAVYVGQDDFGNALFFHKVGWNYYIGWEVCTAQEMLASRYPNHSVQELRKVV